MSRCFTFSAVASSLVMLVTAGCNRAEKKPEPPPPISVLFVTPTTEEVTEFEEFTGRTAATEVVGFVRVLVVI